MASPTVSVLLPVYNAVATLEEALDSLAALPR
jgi:glycosyltransferase involved in cell wall biosynthesis